MGSRENFRDGWANTKMVLKTILTSKSIPKYTR